MDFSIDPEAERWRMIAREFAQNEVAPLARAMDEQENMPRELIDRMGALGLLGGTLQSGFGSAMSHLALALVYEELGRVCSSVRGFVTVHSSLVMQCISAWGSETQKQQHLPKLATGEEIGCYCLTEPEAGSDAASIRTL